MAEVGAIAPPAAPTVTTASPPPSAATATARPEAAAEHAPAAPAAGANAANPQAPTRVQPPAAPPAPAGIPVTVTESAVDLQSLPVPATLAARVVAADAAGQLRLETALGRVVVAASGLAAEPGAPLRLAIDAGGTVRLQPAPAQGQSASTPAATASATPAPAGGGLPALSPGDVVPARLLPAPVAAGATTAPATGHPSHLPGHPPAPQPAAVTVRVLAIGPALPQPPAAGAPPAPLPLLTADGPAAAVVSGRAALGQPVLGFANGQLILDRGELPDGTQVKLEVLHAAKAAAPASPAIAPLTEAIDELLAALAATQPALAAALDSARVPRMGARLGPSAMFLLSALQGGGLPAWIGSDVQQALKAQGRESLLKKIAEALAARAPKLEVEPAAAGPEFWKSLYLPVATPQGWQPLRVAWREPEPGDDGEEGDAHARFRIDFSFSRLGPVRVDGLTGAGRLDLLLVSRIALGAETRGEIEALFADTIGAMGLKGHIRFVEQADLAAPEVRADERHASVTA